MLPDKKTVYLASALLAGVANPVLANSPEAVEELDADLGSRSCAVVAVDTSTHYSAAVSRVIEAGPAIEEYFIVKTEDGKVLSGRTLMVDADHDEKPDFINQQDLTGKYPQMNIPRGVHSLEVDPSKLEPITGEDYAKSIQKRFEFLRSALLKKDRDPNDCLGLDSLAKKVNLDGVVR